MVKIGLIGCGAVVHNLYAKALRGRADYAVAYVCDLNASQAASAARLFRAEIESLERLVVKSDFVVVSTPPATHALIVRTALALGSPVLCEKPYMTSARDAQEISDTSRKTAIPVYVGHFRRKFPQVALARTLVALGLIGEVSDLVASEGGRFTWAAVSNYTTREATGGVLWDTGSHTLDMALFASMWDGVADLSVHDVLVERDKREPSHDFRATFGLSGSRGCIGAKLHVSRKEALPNLVTIRGSRGIITFVTNMDDRLRLTTKRGTAVLRAERSYTDVVECFDLQVQGIFSGADSTTFSASNFVGQVKILEALANA